MPLDVHCSSSGNWSDGNIQWSLQKIKMWNMSNLWHDTKRFTSVCVRSAQVRLSVAAVDATKAATFRREIKLHIVPLRQPVLKLTRDKAIFFLKEDEQFFHQCKRKKNPCKFLRVAGMIYSKFSQGQLTAGTFCFYCEETNGISLTNWKLVRRIISVSEK